MLVPEKSKGFTMADLLITLILLAILAGISMPGFKTLLLTKEGDSALKMLAGNLSLARSAAVGSRTVVTFCRSADGLTCSGSWNDGSIVFTDRNADRILNQDDRIVLARLMPGLQGTIAWRAFQNRQYLQIDARGFLLHQSGNFTYCPPDRDPRSVHQLIVNSTGRTRYARDEDGDGIRENSNGEPLRC